MHLESIRQTLNKRHPRELGADSGPGLAIQVYRVSRPFYERPQTTNDPALDESCRSTAICETCGTEHELIGRHEGQMPLYCTHCGRHAKANKQIAGEQMHTVSFHHRIEVAA